MSLGGQWVVNPSGGPISKGRVVTLYRRDQARAAA